jgi:hypothetical protein
MYQALLTTKWGGIYRTASKITVYDDITPHHKTQIL